MSGVRIIAGNLGLHGEANTALFQRCFSGLRPFGDATAHQHLGRAILGARCKTMPPPGTPLCETTADGRLTLVADVRLDDRNTLLRALGDDLPRIEGPSDGQLILAAWSRWGRACLEHLLGDFSFALWDRLTQTLFCARDALGAKPFYYRQTDHQLLFASALAGLAASHEGSPPVDQWMAARTLMRPRPPAPPARTLMDGVYKLPPAHSLFWNPDLTEPRLERYWHPSRIPPLTLADDREYAEGLRERITLATEDRLRGAKRPASHFSGGLDSSAITALTCRAASRQGLGMPHVYAWQPPPADTEQTQTPEYRRFAELESREGFKTQFTPADAEDRLSVLTQDSLNRPLALAQTLETSVQRQALNDGVDRLLTGWGGDHAASFGGMGWLQERLRARDWRALTVQAREENRSLPRLLWDAARPMIRFRRWTRHRIRKVMQQSCINEALLDSLTLALGEYPRTHSVRARLEDMTSHPHRVQRMEAWHDAGARLGLDYSYPLLDRRVVEFVIAAPAHLHCQGGLRRALFRDAMRPLLPSGIVDLPFNEDPALNQWNEGVYRQLFDRAAEHFAECVNTPQPADRFAAIIDYRCLLKDLARQGTPVPGVVRKLRALNLLDW